MAGHRSRTSTTNRARLRRAKTQAAKIEKKVGDDTTTMSARPLRRHPSTTALTMNDR